MKSYVITIMSNDKSCTVANRCIESAKKFGIICDMWAATTPADNIRLLFQKEGINPSKFHDRYSRLENSMAAFFSHYSLWKKCIELGEDLIIFEHDAVVVNNIPDFMNFDGCINLGRPSYGGFNNPRTLGVNPLSSKLYFPGAHAYRINVSGAKRLVEAAKEIAEPTDVYLRLENFPWLQEYFPWPVECRDTFTTIQHSIGCLAKHGYNHNYKIEDIGS